MANRNTQEKKRIPCTTAASGSGPFASLEWIEKLNPLNTVASTTIAKPT